MALKLNLAASLVNHGVMNDKGENLGKIEEFLVDLETGRIIFAVLSFGRFPNRSKLLVVPWELLKFSAHDKKYILDIPRETIENSPGYDSLDQVSDKADTGWLGNTYQYYSSNPEWEKRREEERQTELTQLENRRREIKGTAPRQEVLH
jgi:sporulation protein YlmC with PRC-barrel domain